jgi:MFS family permease
MFRLRGVTRNVVVLGWVSMLTDMASEMLYPIIPIFIVNVLGASTAMLGLIEGIAEGISTGLRWLGGALSDKYQKRKPFVVWGYGISAFSKPIMGLAAVFGWPVFLLGRASDRFGKSIRSAARDALIADSTEPEFRGVAFGLHRAMDTCGAIVGPLIALAVLGFLPGLSLAWLFVIALIPGILSVMLARVAISDIPHASQAEKVKAPPMFQKFPGVFWHFIIGFAIFSLGNSSDSFLLLRSNELMAPMAANIQWAILSDVPETIKTVMLVTLAYVVYNAVNVVAATPLGKLSDKVGRKPIFICGLVMYAIVYGGFAVWNTAAAPWVLLAVYGLYQALTDGVSKAIVTDLVPKEQRAGAIGLFATIGGLGQLSGSVIAGLVYKMQWMDKEVMAPFAIGAAFALLAIPVIASVRMPGKK